MDWRGKKKLVLNNIGPFEEKFIQYIVAEKECLLDSFSAFFEKLPSLLLYATALSKRLVSASRCEFNGLMQRYP